MNIPAPPHWLIIAAGFGQIFTALVYPFVRHRVFDWYNDIKNLKPLNRQIARTYGYYIQGLNFSFGLISIILVDALLTGDAVAAAFCTIVAFYWIGKIWTQFAYYPMYEIPKGWIFKVGEIGMNVLFFLFAFAFSWASVYLITSLM